MKLLKKSSIIAFVLALFLQLSAGPARLAAQTDPLTGESYPKVFNIGTLNGAPQTAIAIEEGYFDDLGTPAKILFFDSGRDVNTAFASNSIQAGSFGSSPISLGISNHLNYEVVFVNDIIASSETLAVKKSSGIKTLADLKGKKIAAPFASTAHYSLLNALLLGGVKPEEVKLLDLQPQDILAAWVRGDIDGAYVWDPVLAELLKNDGLPLTDSGRLAEQGAITADLSAVSRDFAKKYPTLTAKYVEAFTKSYAILKNEPERAAALVAKNLGIDLQAAKQQLESNNYVSPEDQATAKYLGTPDKPGALAATLKSTADFHVAQKNLDKAGNLDIYQAAVNSRFAQDALKLKK
ncbi:MAG: ABC transporter substrate-binding protein [Candidatus Adiutrix sp.]|jgi:taurine transport system substrate-binding protein|nr:ABC transporter substrate-binding protein [Candidatus Adiutrix sp.]